MSEKEGEATSSHTPPPKYTPTPTPTTYSGISTGPDGTIQSSTTIFAPPLLPPPPPPPTSVMTTPPGDQSPPQDLGRSLQDTTYWTVTLNIPGVTSSAAVLQDSVVSPPGSKSLLEAYLLGLPLGFLGAHHFYLGRPGFGVAYFLTLGLLGVGWLVDLFRMPCLVSSVNKANRAKYEELRQLQQQLQQQRLQHERQYGSAAAAALRGAPGNNVAFEPFVPRSLVDAYIMWFPFGLFGYHHFYLRNYAMGLVYHLTLGMLGIGWLIDLFRMPALVRETNARRRRNSAKSYSQCAAHAFALSPAGIVGGHHFYLNRPLWGFLYLGTFGLLGVGWVFDWFRVTCLVKRANAVQCGERSPSRKYVDDAYILCLPLGFTGLHHFYLRRYCWGVLYLLTLGICGIGWLVDWFRLPCLVRDFNDNLQQSQRLISAGTGNGGLVVTSSGTFIRNQALPSAPSEYPPDAGYGYYQSTYPGGTYPGYVGQGYSAQGVAPPSYEASVENDSTPTKN